MLPAIGAALMIGGTLASALQKRPKADTSSLDAIAGMLEQNYKNIGDYFNQAEGDLATQYGSFYGNEMESAVNALAGSGVFDSPVSEKALQKKRLALAETFAGAKSQLAGQKMQAIAGADSQRIAYLNQLANANYQESMADYEQRKNMWGTIGSLGSSLTGGK